MERNHSSRGWTLIELLVALAVAAILIGLVIPSFNYVLLESRTSAEVENILSAIHAARAEAIKRNHRVSFCPSGDGETCDTSLNWQDGWLLFLDSGTVGDLDSGDDQILRVGGAVDSGYLVYSTKHRDWFGYRPDGSSVGNNGAGNTSFIICKPGENGATGKSVVLSITGRPRVEKGIGGRECTAPQS